jgi:Nucleotidyl transferase AbiEii toxin, Type IV TA system
VFQQLLARLTAVAPGRWILKGGLALEFRLGGIARSTRDMDLVRPDNIGAAAADFLAAQEVSLGEFFTFSIERTEALDEMTTGTAARYRVIARFAGRVFERVVVDVGFGGVGLDAADSITAPDLLGFAGIEPVTVPALSLELHVAEKVHVYTRRYETGASSRVKDLVDLLLICSHTPFTAAALRRALDRTFDVRGSHGLPGALPPPPSDWSPSYRKLAQGVEISEDIASGYQIASGFLHPVLDGQISDDARWEPESRAWRRP